MQPQCSAVVGVKVHVVCAVMCDNKGDEGQDEGENGDERRESLETLTGKSDRVLDRERELDVP